MTLAPPLYGELTSFFLPKALFLEDFLFGPSDEPLIPSLRELVQRAKDGWRIAPHEDPVTRSAYAISCAGTWTAC